MIRIPYGSHSVDESDIDSVVRVLREAPLTQGSKVQEFEQAVAQYVGSKYAVAVSSGTAALHLAVLALELDDQACLLTSPITFVASANAGAYCGLSVEFIDIDPLTANLSAESLASRLSNTTSPTVVIPVHYAGLPCDMNSIKDIADASGAIIIEDAAHALGSVYPNGRRVGCCDYAAMTTFSFHPVKAIAAGEGGMITTNDPELYRRLLRLRSHGINKLDDHLYRPEYSMSDGVQNPWYYEMQCLGYNYRLTDIQCALGLSQLRRLDDFIYKRKELVKAYDSFFSGSTVIVPAQIDSNRDHSAHHLYVVKIDFDAIQLSRAELMMQLRESGIGTQVHYIPVPIHPYYSSRGHKGDRFPNALKFYSQCLSIPLFYTLDFESQQYVAETIISICH